VKAYRKIVMGAACQGLVAGGWRLVEVLPGELDGGGSFADGRGDPFDGAVADISGREDARQAGLQWQRRAV
jgi:hypothetical protein